MHRRANATGARVSGLPGQEVRFRYPRAHDSDPYYIASSPSALVLPVGGAAKASLQVFM